MKKRLFLAAAIIGLCVLGIEDGQASSGGAPATGGKTQSPAAGQTAPKPAVAPRIRVEAETQVVPAVPVERDLKRQRLLISRKKEEINNTTWEVELNPLSGQGKSRKDKIIFADRKVMMDSLTKEGFLATNFTLTLKDDERAVWETMQSKGEDIIFFKGELSPDLSTMNGIVSFQRLEGTKDFSFKSVLKSEVLPE